MLGVICPPPPHAINQELEPIDTIANQNQTSASCTEPTKKRPLSTPADSIPSSHQPSLPDIALIVDMDMIRF